MDRRDIVVRKAFPFDEVRLDRLADRDDLPDARTIDAQRSNFGNNLSIFDWIFGTARLRPDDPEKFGIDEESFPEGNILRQFLFTFRPSELRSEARAPES